MTTNVGIIAAEVLAAEYARRDAERDAAIAERDKLLADVRELDASIRMCLGEWVKRDDVTRRLSTILKEHG